MAFSVPKPTHVGGVVLGQERLSANGSVSKRTITASARVQNNIERGAMRIRLTQDHPTYARLTKDLIVDAEPVANPSELMRVKDFAAFENGALVQGWELILPQEEVEALLNEG